MILKTYARIFTNDAEKSLNAFEQMFGGEPHMRIRFGDWDLIGIGDVMFVGGTDEALAPIRKSHGPFIVDDLDETQRRLKETGAKITKAISPAPTGRYLYATHPDGTSVEYTELKPELVEKWITAPERAGRLSSQA